MPRADPLPSGLEREGLGGERGGLVEPGLGSKTYICSGPRPLPIPCVLPPNPLLVFTGTDWPFVCG